MRQFRLLALLVLVVLGLYLIPWDTLQIQSDSPLGKDRPTGLWSIDFGEKRTLKSTSYDVNYPPTCFSLNCLSQNNLEALAPCSNKEATRLNTLGVRSMERVVGGTHFPDQYTTKYLNAALAFFQQAVTKDPTCVSALANLALVQLKLAKIDDALDAINKAAKLQPALPRLHAIRGFIYDVRLDDVNAKKNWDSAIILHSAIAEGRYMGIMVANDTRMNKHSSPNLVNGLKTAAERDALKDALLYVEFSPIHMSRYAILSPNEPDEFVVKRYTILRNIIPPFLFHSFSKFYQAAIHVDKVLKIGDGQSQRYYLSNDRIARFIQYQLTDLLRRVAAHNAIPSYTYFGGYVEGAVLVPHADRKQCEFTYSLTIYQNPSDQPWPLALGSRTRFEKDKNREGGYLDLPPEDEHVKAPLYEGDALLFMGRHLIHWRVGAQPKEHETYNIFLHYVQSDFHLTLEK